MAVLTTPLSDIEKVDLYTWSLNRRNLRGDDFTIIPPLKYVYRDQSSIVWIEKAAQLFISEFLVNLSLFAADTKWGDRGVALYYFPSTTQLQDFSASRIDPVIFFSPYLAARAMYAKGQNKRANPKQNVGLKQLGEGFIYFRGAQVRNQMISVDADVVIFDEIDRMAEGTIEAGIRRTDSSIRRFVRGASTPEYPERGVDLLIKRSTAKAWIIKCHRCNYTQDLAKVHDFVFKVKGVKSSLLSIPEEHPENKLQFHMSDKYYIGCPSCHGLVNVWNGEWIPERTRNESTIEYEGYHLPKLFSNRISTELLNEIGDKVEKEQSGQLTEAKIQEFYNSILGLPRAPSGTQLDISQIESAALPDPYRFFLKDFRTSFFADFLSAGPKRCFMGVDVGGRRLHVCILAFPSDNDWLRNAITENRPVLVFAGHAENWSDIDALIRQYDVSRFVVDSMPEYRPAAELVKRWPGRGYTSHYPNFWTKRGTKIYEFSDDNDSSSHKDDQQVAIGRSEIFDLVFEYIIMHHLILPHNVRQIGGPIDDQGLGDFVRHLMSLTKIINEKGRAEYINQGDDHLAHALAYAFVAARLSVLDTNSQIDPTSMLSQMAILDLGGGSSTSLFPSMMGTFKQERGRKGGSQHGGIRQDGLIKGTRSFGY